MALSTALLVKGLAGVGAVAGVVGGGFLVKKLLQPKDPNVIIRDLGIEDTACHFSETNTTTVTCTLDTDKLKKVKFEGKNGDTVTENANASLTITKISGVEEEYYTDNLKFTIKNTQDTDLDIGTDPNKITLKKDVSYDFKIKDGTKLGKAWTLKSLAEKVGLGCADDNATECNLPTTGINVWKANDDYITEATQTDTTKKMTVAKDTKDYNGGFKFTVTSDISLTPGTQKKTNGGINKLTQNSTNSTSYEIDLKDLGGDKGKKWFLVEKPTPESSVPQESQ